MLDSSWAPSLGCGAFSLLWEKKSGGFQGGGEETAALFNIRAGRRRALMYPYPGLIPVSVGRGDVREEVDVAARLQHQSREEESPDVSVPGFDPGIRKSRRRQGGDRRRRALSTPGKGGGVPGVSVSGGQGRYRVRRHQGGGRCRRRLQTQREEEGPDLLFRSA